MTDRRPFWIPIVMTAIVGMAIGTRVKGWLGLEPAPALQAQVDTVWAEQARPDVVDPSLGQKIVTGRIAPEQTRVASAPSAAGKRAVELYCLGATAPELLEPPERREPVATDALPLRSADVALPVEPISRLPDFGGRRRGSRLELYSTLNDGRRWSALYNVPGERADWLSDGDSVVVRGDRWLVRVGRRVVKCVPRAAGGGLLGLVVGELELGAAIGAAACLF